ncbi:MAG: hypothetical protein LBE12_16355 [Planctomycetaceae bacterium]|nr:hypothetical protein [Planctomycetaceae bacterium]
MRHLRTNKIDSYEKLGFNSFCLFRFFAGFVFSKKFVTSRNRNTKNIIRQIIADGNENQRRTTQISNQPLRRFGEILPAA